MALITVTRTPQDAIKTVILICYDKQNGKYRSMNLQKRTIGPKLYNNPEEILDELKQLKESKKILDYEVCIPVKK